MPQPFMKPVTDPAAKAATGRPDLASLRALALAGLLPMFNREKQLFCYRLVQTESGLVQEGISPRYTMMTLLGLQRSEEHGMRSPVDIAGVFDGMASAPEWITNIGDLGLLLWTCAAVAPERLEDLSSRLEVAGALSRFRHEGSTMELSWFLSGLAHQSLARPEQGQRFREIAIRTAELLTKNQGGQGFFGHLATRGSLAGRIRGHIGSFADQVYPIYALAHYGRAYRVRASIEAARRCAEGIVRVQGARGQWWWHYDAGKGRVFESYPVYSVHQHAMGPMALFAIGEAAGVNFTRAIAKGLGWIAGNNELGRDLRERADNLVWRNIYPRGTYRRYGNRVRSAMGFGCEGELTTNLDITRECRPYELGWLLYAFAGRELAAGSFDFSK